MVPLLVRMSVPSVAAQMVNLLYNIVDRIYIGHIPGIGTDALAGIGVCSIVIILVAACAQFTGGGGTPLAAIELGRGNIHAAEKILGNGTTLLLILSGLLMLLVFGFERPVLILCGASDATLPYAMEYLSVYMLGTVFVMISAGLNPFINCQGRALIAMLSVLIGAALNIVLDPVFIFVLHMGVRGAAVATVLSQFVSAAWILIYLMKRTTRLRIRAGCMKPEAKVLKPVLALGVSPFIMAGTESLTGLVLNHGLAVYGDIHVSTLTVMQTAMQLVGTPLQGFAQGCSPVISFNYGRGDGARVREANRIQLIIMFSFNFAITLFMILMPGTVAGIFTEDPVLIGEVRRVMPVFMSGMLIFGLQRSCQNTFVAFDEAKISIFIALLRKMILLIPLALVLPCWFREMGVFYAEPIADVISAVTCTLLFALRMPAILRRLEEKQQDGK